jgi:hypothetical protein
MVMEFKFVWFYLYELFNLGDNFSHHYPMFLKIKLYSPSTKYKIQPPRNIIILISLLILLTK